MKFGKRLRTAAVPGWEASYVNYGYLKGQIKAFAADRDGGHAKARPSAHVTMGLLGGGGVGASKGDPISHLTREVEAEMEKVNKFAVSKLQELVDSVSAVSLYVTGQSGSAPQGEECAAVVLRVDNIAATLCNLFDFVEMNGLALVRAGAHGRCMR